MAGFTLAGVPSSAGTHGIGQEQGPPAVPACRAGRTAHRRRGRDYRRRGSPPAEAAAEALAAPEGRADPILVHFDVDAIDSTDFAAGQLPHFNLGQSFDSAMTCLAAFCAHQARFSQATQAGDTIYVAGMVGIGEGMHIPESMAEQMELAYGNVTDTLATSERACPMWWNSGPMPPTSTRPPPRWRMRKAGYGGKDLPCLSREGRAALAGGVAAGARCSPDRVPALLSLMFSPLNTAVAGGTFPGWG